MQFWATLMAIGIPGAIVTAIVGLMVKKIERRMDDERKVQQEQTEARKQFERFQARGLTATMALCEANAIAIQRGKCNGETRKALDYMQNVKREQREFLISQGIEHIF